MRPLIVSADAWSEQRWKNGRGLTHEIWRWTDPRSAISPNEFDLRLSVAVIDGPQAFSTFPGCWRSLVPLDVSELRLQPDALTLTKHRVVSFSGDAKVSAEGSGTTRDLNVMSREARGRALVTIADAYTHDAGHLAVFALTAVAFDEGATSTVLDAHVSWISLDLPPGSTFTTTAPVVWIRF
ncbi:hypothetical protein BH09MYX1_BH09MYX1_16060 [soil metagenome]